MWRGIRVGLFSVYACHVCVPTSAFPRHIFMRIFRWLLKFCYFQIFLQNMFLGQKGAFFQVGGKNNVRQKVKATRSEKDSKFPDSIPTPYGSQWVQCFSQKGSSKHSASILQSSAPPHPPESSNQCNSQRRHPICSSRHALTSRRLGQRNWL